uniref:Retrovirus-related Pol polyprotein from transposon TNT 1-94 n=1 Tax=Panagrellus redivivus TaxID=6233 RepID=A0A7E4ZW34_PANRE
MVQAVDAGIGISGEEGIQSSLIVIMQLLNFGIIGDFCWCMRFCVIIKEGVDDTYKFDAFGFDIAAYPDGCTVHLDNEEEAHPNDFCQLVTGVKVTREQSIRQTEDDEHNNKDTKSSSLHELIPSNQSTPSTTVQSV